MHLHTQKKRATDTEVYLSFVAPIFSISMPPSPAKWPIKQSDAMAVDGDTSGGKGAGRKSALRRSGERGESAAKVARVGSELAVGSDSGSDVEVSPSKVEGCRPQCR